MTESAKQDAITEDSQAKGATDRAESLVHEPKAASKGRKQDVAQHMTESAKQDAITEDSQAKGATDRAESSPRTRSSTRIRPIWLLLSRPTKRSWPAWRR
jgi:ATP-dependent protease ClpP protease subunit